MTFMILFLIAFMVGAPILGGLVVYWLIRALGTAVNRHEQQFIDRLYASQPPHDRHA